LYVRDLYAQGQHGGELSVNTYAPKGFENLVRALEQDGTLPIRRPMIIMEHDYAFFMGWTTQEFGPLLPWAPRDNVERNHR
jgi:hypothetical protein